MKSLVINKRTIKMLKSYLASTFHKGQNGVKALADVNHVERIENGLETENVKLGE